MQKGQRLDLGDNAAFVGVLAVGASGALEPARGPQVHSRYAPHLIIPNTPPEVTIFLDI